MNRRRAVAIMTAALCCLPAASCGLTPSADGGPVATQESDTGAGEVWSTGLNDTGQLGRRAADMDVALAPVVGPGGKVPLDRIVSVAAGQRHSLALTADGKVYAWGSNSNGQLGNGTGKPSWTPVPVNAPDGKPGALQDVTAISAAGGLSMALRRDGTVVTWGSGSGGQRGIGTPTAPPTPTTVRGTDGSGPLTGVTSIAAGERNGLAALSDGSVLSWGAAASGILGDGQTATPRSLPGPVVGEDGTGRLSGIASLSVGGTHVLALTRDGQVLAWGRNDRGQLGDGTQKGRAVPGRVKAASGDGPLSEVTSVSAGGRHNYALLRDGTMVAWGDNVNGQLGNGSTTASARPIQVAGAYTQTLRGVDGVEAGQGYGVALLAGSSALSWGAAGKGQIGSGNRIPRSRPGPFVMAHGAPVGRFVAVSAGDHHLIVVMRARPS